MSERVNELKLKLNLRNNCMVQSERSSSSKKKTTTTAAATNL